MSAPGIRGEAPSEANIAPRQSRNTHETGVPEQNRGVEPSQATQTQFGLSYSDHP